MMMMMGSPSGAASQLDGHHNNININNNSVNSSIRWRHIQAQVRMLQILSVLSDSITDWDCVVDALDQIHRHYATKKLLVSDEVSISEVEKVFAAIDRYTNNIFIFVYIYICICV
jgi:hypothetical protein